MRARPLHDVSLKDLRALLEEEKEHWGDELLWDYSEVSSAVANGVERHALTGRVIHDGPRAAAYCYYMLDSGRASVVGEHTFGRAAIQKAVALPDGGLVLTVAKYSSPKGTAIHGKGVEPSVPVAAPDDAEEGEGGAKRDLILEKALEVLRDGEAKKAAA